MENKIELLKDDKIIHIPIHGSCNISKIAKYFIDNKYFQRLRKLKQLGACENVFPSATHTRFEHSIGTYYLSKKILERIKMTTKNKVLLDYLFQINELKDYFIVNIIDNNHNYNNDIINWIFELVSIGALCHDLGHGPYSHLFDDVFIKKTKLQDHIMATHELRSCIMVENIVNNNKILKDTLSENDIKFIQSIINPTYDHKGFIYQIVSNYMNGLDVDKYDYINRDCYHLDIKNGFSYQRLIDNILIIDNKIVYQEQSIYDIFNLFQTRHILHKKCYSHKACISSECILTEIMIILDKTLNISESIKDMDKFLDMTDGYILQYADFIIEHYNLFNSKINNDDLLKLKSLIKRIKCHNLYPVIGIINTKNDIDIADIFYDSEKYHVIKRKIGYVSGDKQNPLDRIYIYKTKDIVNNNLTAIRINKNDISYVMPETFQEYITLIYRKDNDIEAIKDDKKILDNFISSLKL
jgi:HD superfamily phosphohydrolase